MANSKTGPDMRHGQHVGDLGLGVEDSQFQIPTPVAPDDVTLKGTNGDDSLVGGDGNDTLFGLYGSDTLIGGKGDDLLVVKDLNDGDVFDGGKGYDTLSVKKAVDIDFGASTLQMTGIEQINLSKQADNVVLANGMDAGVSSLVIHSGTGNDTIDGSAVTDIRLDISGGGGSDLIYSGGKADIINGGTGRDTIVVTSQTLHGDVINGGQGSDTLLVNGGGSVDLHSATITSIELVQVGDDATTLTLNDSGMTVNAGGSSGTIILGGAGYDDITLGVAGQTVFTGGGYDAVHATADTLFDGSTGSVLSGSGYATLALTGGGSVDFSTFSISGFGDVLLNNETYAIDMSSYGGSGEGAVSVEMGNGNSSLITGEGSYAITGGVSGNTVDMTNSDSGSSFISGGTGVDNVTMDFGQTALLSGGDDNVTINFGGEFYSGEVGLINGGSGSDTLHLNGFDSWNYVQMGSNIVSFETIDMSQSSNGIELDMNSQAMTVIGSDYNDTFDVGSSSQTINGGAGDDTVNITANLLTPGFVFDGGDGHDTVDVYVSGGMRPVHMGDPVPLVSATLGVGVVNVEQVDVGMGVALHLTNQSDININNEGGNVAVYAGSGSGIDIYFDESTNYVDLEGASGVTVSGEWGGTTVKLGSGSNYDISVGEGNNTVIVSDASQFDPFTVGESSYQNTISGGEGDTLEFAGGGTYDLHDVNLSGFNNVTIDAGVAVDLTLNDAGYDVSMGDQAATSVTGGEGEDTFRFGAAGQTAVGGDGNDTYVVAAGLLNSVHITEVAEGGYDTVTITGGGVMTLDSSFANVEAYSLAETSTVTIQLDATSNPDGYSITGSDYDGSTLTANSGDDTFIINGGLGLQTNSPQLFSGVTIDGGSNSELGGDTIEIAGGGIVDFSAAGVTITNIENVVLDAASNLTLNGDSYDVTGSAGVDTITGGAGNDTIDGGAGIDLINAGDGNDTVTINAASADTVDAGAGFLDVAKLTGAAAGAVTVDLSAGGDQISVAGVQSNFENLDASGLTGFGVKVTAGTNTTSLIGSAQSDVFIFGAGDLSGVTVAGGLSSDILRVTGDNDLTAASISGVEALELDGVGTDLTVNSASLTGVTSISDTGGNDVTQSLIITNSTNLSAVTVTNIETLSVTGASTLTIDQSKLTGVTAISGDGSVQDLTVSTGSLDLTSIALTGFESVHLASGSTMTAQAADLAGVSSIIGAAGSETLTVLDTADLSTLTLSSVETLKFGGVGTTLTVDQAHLGGVTAITGNAAAGDVLATSANLNLSAIALTAVETIDMNGATTMLTANAADLASVTNINGAGGAQTLSLLNSTDISGITFSALETISYGVAGINVTIDQAKLTGVTNIAGNAGAGDILTMKAGTDLDLSGGLAISAIEELDLGGGGTSLTVNSMADLTGVSVIKGGVGADTLDVLTGDVNLSAIAVTGVESIHTEDATGSNLRVNAADIAGLTALTMDGASDILTLVNADSALDISGATLTGVETISLGNNADVTANTLTVLDQLDGSGDIVNLNGSLSVSDTVAMVDAGTIIDFNSINVSGVEHIVLGDALDASANTLDLNAANAAGITSIVGGGDGSADTIALFGGGSFNFSTLGVSNVQFVDTGDTAVNLTLNGGGYDVSITDTTGNTITSGSGADVFVFHGDMAGDSDTINGFVSGVGGDVLDLSHIGVTAYQGEFVGDAAASSGLLAHGAAFSQASHTLFVDIDGTAGYNAATDLAIVMTGVTDLTAGTDILVV